MDTPQALQEKFGHSVTSTTEFRGEKTVCVTAEAVHDVLRHCRDALAFDLLLDISSVDHADSEPRFEMVYELYSVGKKEHLRVKCPVAEDPCEIPTVSDLWATANWHEREVYDMMGIRFQNHPDLRRILMWEGYPHFPLRKEFPLAGKDTDVPEVAFTHPAPLAGGPFVTTAGAESTVDREPRAKP